MAAVDEVREALERAVPDFSGYHGDWDAVLGKARASGAYRSRRRWRLAAVAAGAAVAAAAALALFWPAGHGEGVIARARAAVGDRPVTHVVLRGASIEVYDLERHKYRSVPDVQEEWFDPARGFHIVRRIGSRPYKEFRGGAPVRFPEGVEAFAGIATAYRHALATGKASLGPEVTVQGHRVYWIRFSSPGGVEQYEVAVDAQTYEPRFVRIDGGPVSSLRFETLAAGEGDFTLSRRKEPSSWSETSRPGPLSPEEARDALQNALWLGERFGTVPLSSIREVRWEPFEKPSDPDDFPEPVRALELCYGSGGGCAVFLTEATQPMAGSGKGWPFAPPGGPPTGTPPGTLGLGDASGFGYLTRDGIWVTIHAGSREELIAAAEALRRIP